jgi:hypothetical protein
LPVWLGAAYSTGHKGRLRHPEQRLPCRLLCRPLRLLAPKNESWGAVAFYLFYTSYRANGRVAKGIPDKNVGFRPRSWWQAGGAKPNDASMDLFQHEVLPGAAIPPGNAAILVKAEGDVARNSSLPPLR